MIEVCFCGWRGPVEDRKYVQFDDHREALSCPNCGHVDTVEYLPELSQRDLLAAAKRRTADRRLNSAPVLLQTADPAA